MAWFATPTSETASEAFRLCDLLDEQVNLLHEQLRKASAVLDEAEYSTIASEFETVVAPLRELRAQFDRCVDAYPVSQAPGTAGEQAYGGLISSISAALQTLDQVSGSFQRYGNAKAETEYAAGQLAAELAHARTLGDVLPASSRDGWLHRIQESQGRLNEAAAEATERRWLHALELIAAERTHVAEMMATVTAQVTDTTQGRAALTKLSELLGQVRHGGAQAVALQESLKETLPAPVHSSTYAKLTAVGRTVVSATAVFNSQRDTDLPDVAALEASCTDLAADLDRLTEVMAELAPYRQQVP